MAWNEVSAGRLERAADSIERYYAQLGEFGAPFGQEQLAFSFGIKLQHSLPQVEGELKQAWIALRFECPKLAAEWKSGTLVYEKTTADGVEVWAKETFITKGGTCSAELFPSLTKPSSKALLYYLLDTSELVFFTSHWRLDGGGACLLLDAFLKHLATPSSTSKLSWGEEIASLQPGLDDVFNLPDKLSEEEDAAQNLMLQNWGAHLPCVSVPPISTPPIPSPVSAREELAFSKNLSSAIVSACKKRDYTPTAAAHAALIAATVVMKAIDNPAKNYASWVAMSLRHRAPAAYQGSAWAVQCAHTGMPIAFTPSGSFDTDAQEVQAFYKGVLTDQTINGLQVFHDKLIHMLKQPLPEGAPIPADPALNNIGVVDRYIQESYGKGDRKLDVTGFWVGNTQVLFNIWVHIWSFQGKTTLSALYNTGLYSQTQVKELLQRMRDILIKELDIKDE